ncbi:HAD family hydrolase [Corynebacterium endometrii]|uniref:(S)-2-haloacid dehalogenase 4A n=1 Tax=Corynebacterium endometrii TaxID=2488819 RepID=A0A4P7QDB7_9CORY|nr:HAD family hydrolase [Corynebacterium endometrii]QCB27343.1 (S)-2-haloacid dehalogenase 4A [Corynebacterium endometrii]
MITAKAVLFDLDGTLTDHERAMAQALDEWCVELGMPTGQHQRFRDIELKWFHRFERGEISHQDQRIGRTREFTGRTSISDAAATELFADYLAAYEKHWQAYPDAVACVQRALDAGLKVGILTNGRADMQAGKMRAGGVDLPGVELFATVDMGTPKPQPGAYHRACAALGVDPADTVMIGDNWPNDVAGARAAGLRAVYIPRDNLQDPATPPSAAAEAISSLDELTFRLG